MILLIDNFDSFTYNLAHALSSLNQNVRVERNNTLSLDDITTIKPHALVISPGPGRPENSGITPKTISLAKTHHIPIFGVCLGLQAIGQFFGAKIIHAPRMMHGKISPIQHHNHPLFSHVPSPFLATRYHSLIIDPDTLPPSLNITAQSEDDNLIMALSHKELPLAGVQFHPESIASPFGLQIIANFLSLHNIPFSDPFSLLHNKEAS